MKDLINKQGKKNEKVSTSFTSLTSTSTVGAYQPILEVAGTDIQLDPTNPQQALFVQAYRSKLDAQARIRETNVMRNAGVTDFRQSPIYYEFETTNDSLKYKLNIILKVMKGEVECDFKRVEKKGEKYVVIEPTETKNLDDLLKTDDLKGCLIKAGKEQPFPSYSTELSAYAGGRYENMKGSKPDGKPNYRYFAYQMNYFESKPLNKEEFEVYISDPIGNLYKQKTEEIRKKMEEAKGKKSEETNSKKVEEPKITISIGDIVNIYQGEKKFDFTYTPSQTAQKIFEVLRNIYLKTLEKSENPDIELEVKYIPKKQGNLFVDDYLLKIGSLEQLACIVDSQSVFDNFEELKIGTTYTEYYVNVHRMIQILNAILGQHNWTVEVTNDIVWDGKRVIRGYYVDVLGNFKYGQLVTAADVKIGNTAPEKHQNLVSNLTRTLIMEVFPVLKALTPRQYERIKEFKASVIKSDVSDALIFYRRLIDDPKSLAFTKVKPEKRISEDTDFKVEKRLLEDVEKRDSDKKEDNPKEINKESKGITIEETD